MPNLDLSFAQDPNTLSLALICGMIPAIAWLFFWLRENREHPRSGATLSYVFLAGVFMVILALPVEKFLNANFSGNTELTILFAATEELLKFGAFLAIISATGIIESPIDYPVYLIVIALGFAGFENALYLLEPLQAGAPSVLILAGTMRFLGTTLMHATAASLAGIGLGFAAFKSKTAKALAAALGLAFGIAVHSLFNIFIVMNQGADFFQVFGLLWVMTIILLALFEKLRKMGSSDYLARKRLVNLESLETRFNGFFQKLGSPVPEAVPLSAILSDKKLPSGRPQFAELAALIANLRKEYEAYLARFGAPQASIGQSAKQLIPDTASAQAVRGVLAVLKREDEKKTG